MKRAIALLLAIILALGLIGCGGAAPAEPTPEPTATPEPTPEPIVYTQADLGQEITAGTISILLEKAETLTTIRAIREGAGHSQNPSEGKKYIAIFGTVKNTGNASVNIGTIMGSIVVDGELTYTLQMKVVQDRTFNSELAPISEGKIYLYAEVPQELADSFDRCDLFFGFNSDFSKADDIAACENLYQMELSTDESAENVIKLRIFAPVEYKMGDLITTDFLELKFSEVQINSKLRKKYKGTTYTYATDGALDALCLVGTIKNTSTEPYNPCLSGYAEVDGYKYEIKDWELCQGLKVAPLATAPIYIFAQIPKELSSGFSSCTFHIGFNEGFTNTTFTEIAQCEYAYTVTWNRG